MISFLLIDKNNTYFLSYLKSSAHRHKFTFINFLPYTIKIPETIRGAVNHF